MNETIIGLAILVIAVYIISKRFSGKNIDKEEERMEIEANLNTTLEMLTEVDQQLTENEMPPEALESPEGIHKEQLLKNEISRKQFTIQQTLEKIEIEGDKNWGYRKKQAKRVIEDAKALTQAYS